MDINKTTQSERTVLYGQANVRVDHRYPTDGPYEHRQQHRVTMYLGSGGERTQVELTWTEAEEIAAQLLKMAGVCKGPH